MSRVQESLDHRGPDGRGAEAWDDAVLAHTRLAILDRTERGHQPLSNEDGSVSVVFNGEIYNHRELRTMLAARGHRLVSSADTEVIPHLYEEFGLDFATHLRGMFAIAVYDARRHELVLARDRFGIKPLFYAPTTDRLMFASELNALREMPGIDLTVDRQAVSDYAALFFVPAPQTLYTGIRALEPGCILHVTQAGGSVSPRVRRYHAWTRSPLVDVKDLTEASRLVEEKLDTAVGSQLESEVPLGALLSGGIDSSLVVVAAAKASASALRTFSVAMPDAQYDETWAARSVAAHAGTNHLVLEVESGSFDTSRAVNLLLAAGQPYADSSLFAANLMCGLVREHVTVALAGDGGDEAFGGYASQRWSLAVGRLLGMPQSVWRSGWSTAGAAARGLGRIGRGRPGIDARLRDLGDARGAADVAASFMTWVRRAEHKRLCHGLDALPVQRLFEPTWEGGRDRTAVDRLEAALTEAQMRLRMANDYLFKVDLASMQESLEVRVPMLDEDLFATGLRLPRQMKVGLRENKRVLREIARRQLPAAVATKPKGGFSFPLDRVANDEFRQFVGDELLGAGSAVSGFLDPAAYRSTVESFCRQTPSPDTSRAGVYERVVMLLALQLHLGRRLDRPSGATALA